MWSLEYVTELFDVLTFIDPFTFVDSPLLKITKCLFLVTFSRVHHCIYVQPSSNESYVLQSSGFVSYMILLNRDTHCIAAFSCCFKICAESLFGCFESKVKTKFTSSSFPTIYLSLNL